VGFWPLIDEASNLRNSSSVVSTFDTPFVSAVAGGSATVLSFLGHKDSYVLLENQGDLSVTSFTWAAKLFPESLTEAPLFNWEYANTVCGFHGPHIWLTAQAKLQFAVCDGVQIRNHIHSVVLGLGEWHDAAMSYDGLTGAVHIRVAGVVEAATLPPLLEGSTSGPVLMGSRYYNSGNLWDVRSFHGRMACVRLWRGVSTLSSIAMDPQACDIN
jgi:hypothetical protein